MAVIQRERDDAVLLLRQSYRAKWTLPGGLLKRGESAPDAVRREVSEEVALDVEIIDDQPRIRVDPKARLVDVVFRVRVTGSPEQATPASPEILETRWFAPDSLPDLQLEAGYALSCWGVPR